MKLHLAHHRRRGSALIFALTAAVIIAGFGATAFLVTQSKFRVVHQAASWKEALLTAEAGVEMAVTEIRRNLFDPESAWEGWTQSAVPVNGMSDGTGATMTYKFTSQPIIRQGEGGVRSIANVTVDAPLFLRDRTGEQWFRIRVTGTADVPGGGVAAGEKNDLKLRKFNLRFDRRTGRALSMPQATRTIEAIAKPVGAFRMALFGIATIDMTDHNIVVDSYDSRDTTKSTNGRYDIAKRQENGDIATNGKVIQAGNAHIYGDALTNEGSVLDAANITGELRDDFYQEVFLVKRPTNSPDAGTPTIVNQGTVFTARPGTPSSYLLSSLTLAGNEELRIAGAADGSPTYCQIVVTGDVALAGQSRIVLDPGVAARIFVVGNADVTGNGVANSGSPLNFQLYGCDRPTLPDGSPASFGTMKITGNGGFSGAVYAPNYNVEIKGGGTADNIYGAFVGNIVRLNGVQAVHYDEALADGGLISDFKIVSWFEDEK